MRGLSRTRVVVALWAGVFCHCGSDPFLRMRTTQVSREHRVTAPPPADGYFAAVHGYQVALSGVDLRRAESLASLARTLGHLENAERTELAAALQARVTEAGASRVRVQFVELGTALDPRLAAWEETLRSPPADEAEAREAQRARFAAIVDMVEVTLTPNVASEALNPTLDAVAAVLREAEATRRCMERLSGDLPPVLAQGEELQRAMAPRLAREFAAAERFLQSVHARATLQAQESVRLERWVFATLAPETDEAPEEEEGSGEGLDGGVSSKTGP